MVSVIVAFRDAARYIGTMLESLVAQRVTVGWEVVLIDNGSRDDSRRIAETFKRRLPLRIVDAHERANIGYARNVGVRVSSGANLLFADADDALEDGYVSAMVEALQRHVFVTSRVDSTVLNERWALGAHGPHWQASDIGTFYDFLPAAGSNIGIRRSLYDQLGGFSEDFVGCEDIAFSWNAALTTGVTPQFIPEAVYRYRYRDTLPSLFSQAMIWGFASTRLFRRFRSLGMPARPIRLSIQEWRDALVGVIVASDKASRAPCVVRLGYCVGRLRGSVRHRIMFL